MWSLIVLMSPFACAEFTRFSRQPALENKKIVDATSVVMTSVSLNECARECHDNSSCLSFLHNQDGGRCQMMSRFHVNNEESMTENGNKIFAKNIDGAMCPVPEVNNGRVLYTDGLVEGSIAEFVCDDYYYQTTETGVCDICGTWQGLDNACNYYQIPVAIPTNGKLFPGSCVTVIGTPTLETFFNILMYEKPPESDIPLVLSPHFSHGSDEKTIVMTSKISNDWASYERYSASWPFAINQEFNITICLEETLFRIIVDDVGITTYAYRKPDPEIETFSLEYDVVVRDVIFNG